MVCGLPEPPDVTDLETDTATNEGFPDTDTDEDINEYSNYQPLPFNPDAEDFVSEGDSDVESEGEVVAEASSVAVPPIIPADCLLSAEVWASQPPKDIEMDSKKIDEVKQAMMNVTLPDSSIPAWASSVPEDVWKERLMQRIHSKSSFNQ